MTSRNLSDYLAFNNVTAGNATLHDDDGDDDDGDIIDVGCVSNDCLFTIDVIGFPLLFVFCSVGLLLNAFVAWILNKAAASKTTSTASGAARYMYNCT